MRGVFTVIGTLARGYNARAVKILVNGGLPGARAKAIAGSRDSRTYWTGRLDPDKLLEAKVSLQIVEELGRAGLLGMRSLPRTIIFNQKDSIDRSIKEHSIPVHAISEIELSKKIGETVKFERSADIPPAIDGQLAEIIKENFWAHLDHSIGIIESANKEKDFRMITAKNESGKVLGMVSGAYDGIYGPGTISLRIFTVRKEYQNKGIGYALMQAFFEMLKEQEFKDYKRVYIACHHYDRFGHDLKEHLRRSGFVLAGTGGDRDVMVRPTAYDDTLNENRPKMKYNS
jgi:GNAT superfamily N-acetyltransferase